MIISLQHYSDFALLFLRVVVAAIFMYHALPKLKTPEGMAQGMGWPKAAVRLLGSVEFISAWGVLLGFYIQIAAILLMLVMLGAMRTKMMKWGTPFSAGDKTGWEFDLVLFSVNFLFLVLGGGAIGIH